MNAEVQTMFRSAEYRQAEKIARLCDHLRATGDDVAAHIADNLVIDDRTDVEGSKFRALELLDIIESMDFEQVGRLFVNQLMASYEKKL